MLGLVPPKNDKESLFLRLQTYLDEYARLHAIGIDCQLTRDEANYPEVLKESTLSNCM